MSTASHLMKYIKKQADKVELPESLKSLMSVDKSKLTPEQKAGLLKETTKQKEKIAKQSVESDFGRVQESMNYSEPVSKKIKNFKDNELEMTDKGEFKMTENAAQKQLPELKATTKKLKLMNNMQKSDKFDPEYIQQEKVKVGTKAITDAVENLYLKPTRQLNKPTKQVTKEDEIKQMKNEEIMKQLIKAYGQKFKPNPTK